MLGSIYLVFMVFALITIITTFTMPSFGKFSPLIAVISAILCAFLSISSGDMTSTYCPDNATISTDCFEYTHSNGPLVWFWGGMFLVMLLMAIYALFDESFRQLLKTMT